MPDTSQANSDKRIKGKRIRMIGIRLDVVARDDIYYCLYYDIDRELKPHEIEDIDALMHLNNISYLLFTTKHGAHLIGLTPMTHTKWASMFSVMKNMFNSYYGGIIIRLSRKKEETQVLLKIQEYYGEVIPNLFNLYASRFNLQKKPWTREFSKYILQFEKYRSKKE